MNNEFIYKLMEELEKKLHISKNDDLIDVLFNDRLEKFHEAITKNQKYKAYMKKVNNIDKEISKKFENRWEIINIIEKYTNATDEGAEICEKLMYKYGVLDGMLLILQGTKHISIENFIAENKE